MAPACLFPRGGGGGGRGKQSLGLRLSPGTDTSCDNAKRFLGPDLFFSKPFGSRFGSGGDGVTSSESRDDIEKFKSVEHSVR